MGELQFFQDKNHDNVFIYQPISVVCDLHGVKNDSCRQLFS